MHVPGIVDQRVGVTVSGFDYGWTNVCLYQETINL